MYWADELAQQIKKRKLPFEWVDDMKTPSGRIHVGSLRGVVVHDLVYKALKDTGAKTKYTYVFEDHDPMDDIPVYLPREQYEQYLGMPLFAVPSPEKGYAHYAEYFALEFEKVFTAIGCNPEIIWTSDLYKSGKMNADIKLCLDEAQKIRDIYKELYDRVVPTDWFPFQVYCENCKKVSTTKVSEWDGENVTYQCHVDAVDWTKGCGHSGKISPLSTASTIPGKLPWKVEWPVKWKAIGVTVEGAGKDHMSAGGSHDFAQRVCSNVINYPVPFPVPYEFFLIGGKKMSSSKGRGSSAIGMLDILPPELLRFLMVKTKLNQAINFDPSGNTIPKLFDEYQKAADAYFQKTDPDLARMFELSQISEVRKPPTVRFSVLAQWIQMPNMEKNIEKENLTEWVKYAKIWIEQYAPDSEKFLISEHLPETATQLTDTQKAYLKKIADEIDKEWTAEDFQVEMYEWAKALGLSSKDSFSAIYQTLIGKDHGPKAAWLILSLDKTFIKKRFSEAVQVSQHADNQHQSLRLLNNSDLFSIDNAVKETYPTISVGVAVIKNVTIEKTHEALEKEKQKVLASFEHLTTEQINSFPEIRAYRKLYKDMGIDWHSRRPSPEALLRRIALKKGLYTVNTCVDAYNLIVMKHKVSVGAFDLDALSFPTVLRFPKVDEEILLLGDTNPTSYKATELAYFDLSGGFNIDFNYRDAIRTAVQIDTKNLYINVDGIETITPQKVEEILKETCDTIMKYCGGTLETFGVEIAS